MNEKERTYEDGSPAYTLEETIQNYYNVGCLMSESELQTLSWLKELRDLRAILNEREPKEAVVECTIKESGIENVSEDDPWRLEDYQDSLARNCISEDEEQILFWISQLNRARNRVQKDEIE